MTSHVPIAITAAFLIWWNGPSNNTVHKPPAPSLTAERFANLHHLIKPAPGEARWAEVPWMPSTNLWAARQKAAAEGKPLFLWYMAGEPLGVC